MGQVPWGLPTPLTAGFGLPQGSRGADNRPPSNPQESTVDKPTFDRFHPNYDECTNAVNCAEQGDFERACKWLNQAQSALEYHESLADYQKACDFVQERAAAAGVTLSRSKVTWRENWGT